MKKILSDRVGIESNVLQLKVEDCASNDTTDEELAAEVLKHYKGKMSSNIKKVSNCFNEKCVIV